MQQEYTPIGCEHKLPNGLSAWQFQSEMRSNINGGSLVAIHVCRQCGDIRIVGYRTSEDGKHVDRFNETFDLHHASAIDAIIKAANFFNEEIKWGRIEPGGQSAGTWVKASERLPKIIDKKATPKHVKCEVKKQDGSGAWIKKQVAYYFPEHFKTIEWEDWDDYSEEDFPYTENDEKNGIVWLRPGWYCSVECDNCEGYWSAPLNVVEWLDEAALPDNKEREEQAEWEFVQILKENYEAAKRSDEYQFAGKTKKEAVVETYEDLFEIIKGLPLKRQKVDFSFVNNKEEKSEPYYGMTCPHCGAQTNVDPALVKDDDPMPYCPECDEPIFPVENDL